MAEKEGGSDARAFGTGRFKSHRHVEPVVNRRCTALMICLPLYLSVLVFDLSYASLFDHAGRLPLARLASPLDLA